jgi:hypothetical protein
MKHHHNCWCGHIISFPYNLCGVRSLSTPTHPEKVYFLVIKLCNSQYFCQPKLLLFAYLHLVYQRQCV